MRLLALALAWLCLSAGSAAAAELTVVAGGHLERIDDAGRQLGLLTAERGGSADWTADGQALVALRASTYDHPVLLRAPFTTPTPLMGGDYGTYSASISANGRLLAFSITSKNLPNARVRVRDVSTGRAYELEGSNAEFSPDGTQLAYQAPGGIAIAPLAEVMTERASTELPTPPRLLAYGRFPDWSPDGKRLVFIGADRALRTIGVDGSDERVVVPAAARAAGAPSWSPDGERIAYLSTEHHDGRDVEVHAVDPDGGCRTQLTWTGWTIHAVAWRPGTGPARRGPCGGRAPQQFGFARLTDASRRGLRIVSPGRQHAGLLLSAASPGVLEYGDCDRAPERCPKPMTLRFESLCSVPRGVRLTRFRGAVAWQTRRGGARVAYGRTRMAVDHVPESVSAFLAGLRPRAALVAPAPRRGGCPR